jgi:acyl-CoA reductase-like NAD-dependent aldehyde dehydrogenase
MPAGSSKSKSASKRKNGRRALTSRAATKKAALVFRNGGKRVGILKTYKLYIGGKFPRTESGRYDILSNSGGDALANICRASKKDFREAVVAARAASSGWGSTSAFLRGQIMYRIAEMLEGRSAQLVEELELQGFSRRNAGTNIEASIDRLVYYAGWADKFQQIFSSVNPVSSSHFNFSLCEPTGIVAVAAPEDAGLLGLVSNLAPATVGGNTCVLLASQASPLSAVTFAEVLHASDVPAGVVNILTGRSEELLGHFSTHMDVNAIVYCGSDSEEVRETQWNAAGNVKRAICRDLRDWYSEKAQSPYMIADTQEIKTTWHPIGT